MSGPTELVTIMAAHPWLSLLAGGGLAQYPILKKNLEKVVALFLSPLDLAKAKLDAVKAGIDAKGKVNARRLVAEARAFEKEVAADAHVRARAASRFEARLIREQRNSEAVLISALRELGPKPPAEDAKGEIDEDWLNGLARAAESRSSEYFQALFGKILAGEIRQPGRFCPATVDALMKITPDVAVVFQRFADSALYLPNQRPFLVTNPFPNPGFDGLKPVGLGHVDLATLDDNGLVRYSLDAFTIAPRDLRGMLGLGSQTVFLSGEPADQDKQFALKVYRCTRVGGEIISIMERSSNAAYLAAFVTWAKDKVGLDAVVV